MKVYIGRYPSEALSKRDPDAKQKKSIRIDRHDTWNMAETLGEIILPMLKQLRASKHGSPGGMKGFQEDSNHHWPQMTFDFYKEDDNKANDLGHKQWEAIMDKMVWSFEQICMEDRDDQFHTGKHDIIWTKVDVLGNEVDSTYTGEIYYRMDKGPLNTHAFDKDAYTKYYEKIQEGLDLFGEHYMGLWD